MNFSVFYASSIIISAAGIFFLWHLGLKRLMLDDFRDSLFAVRDRLYRLAQDGRVSCDDKAYRAVEFFINNVIRYAHRFTFLSFLFSLKAFENAQMNEQQAARSRGWLCTIDDVESEAVRNELNAIVMEVTSLLPRYIGRSSLAFIVSSILYFAFHWVSPLIAGGKDKAVRAFETEAYRAAESGSYAQA